MSEDQTPETTMKPYTMTPPMARGMPEPVRAVFAWCHAYHCRLRRINRSSARLFGAGPQTIHLLNMTAPTFFFDVFHAFQDEMALCITRLTAASFTGRNNRDENVGLERLIELVEQDGATGEVIDRLMQILGQARVSAKPILKRRNKLIAHSDAATLIGGEEIITKLGTDLLETIMERFDEILNRIQVHYGGQEIPRDFLEVGADANRLIDRLKR